MANANLTVEEVRRLLDYDPETGLFARRLNRGKWAAGPAKGTIRQGYVFISLNYKSYAAHRLAWFHYFGKQPPEVIDHINGDKTDNRICNLRAADFTINSQNQRRPRSDNTSGYLGVTWSANAKRWRAKIQVGGRSIHIGLFDTPEAAYKAYVAVKRYFHAGSTL